MASAASAGLPISAWAEMEGSRARQLRETLWPELAPEAAAANLRKVMHFARLALAPEHLRLHGELLRLEAPRLWVDVEAFEAAADAGDVATAIRRYQLLLARADEQEAAGEPGAAATLERLAAADPLNEQAVSSLMRAYALAGQRHLALGWYHRLEAGLAEELGVQPRTQVRQLREEIASGRFPAAPADSGTRRAEAAPSIAVLPFADLTPEGDHEYFCSGIAEELIDSATLHAKALRGLGEEVGAVARIDAP